MFTPGESVCVIMAKCGPGDVHCSGTEHRSRFGCSGRCLFACQRPDFCQRDSIAAVQRYSYRLHRCVVDINMKLEAGTVWERLQVWGEGVLLPALCAPWPTFVLMQHETLQAWSWDQNEVWTWAPSNPTAPSAHVITWYSWGGTAWGPCKERLCISSMSDE